MVIRQWVRDEKFEAENPDVMKIAETPQTKKEPSKILSFNIDGVDLRKGLERFGNDDESFLSVLHSYAVNTGALLDKAKAVTLDGLVDYAITVHGIKGSSYGICAQTAGEKAETLEHASKAGDMDFVLEHNSEFIGGVEKLLADLNGMLGAIEAETLKPKKDKPDKEALNRLLEACKTYDMDTVEEIAAELESSEYESDGELVKWICENAKQFNLDAIVEKLSAVFGEEGEEK
jgi:hypothetical protein